MEKTSDFFTRDRKTSPGRVYRLGNEPSDDLSPSTSPEERLAMMWELVEAAWTWAGRSFPDYDRGNMPGGVRRGCR